MKKRGEIEIQFNWIMILVAGGLIFLFFFSIIKWASKSSDQSSSITISNYLDSLLSAATVMKDTVNKDIYIAKDIEFTCNSFRVSGMEKESPINNKIIFAPSKIPKGNAASWSYSWDAPYRSTNFLFLSSPQVRYIVYGNEDDEIFSFLENNFPLEYKIEFNPATVDNFNNYKVRFIFVNTPVDNSKALPFKSMMADDVTALYIDSSYLEGNFNRLGTLSFYKKSAVGVQNQQFIADTQETYFFKQASLLGAIFSETKEEYECNMQKAFLRLVSISEIYSKRSEDLGDEANGGDANCLQMHKDAQLELSNILNSARALSSSINSGDYGNFVVSYINLENQNSNLQQESCPLVY